MDSFFLEGTPSAKNLSRVERTVFVIVGTGLLGLAAASRKKWAIPIGALGGSLLYSGVRGHSYLYQVLDVDRSGNGGVVVEQAITVGLPAAETYAYWRNFENFPRFMRHLESVRKLDETRSHWVAKAPLGTTVEWEAEITGEAPGEFITWRSLPGAMIENGGLVHFRDAPGNRGTEVRVVLEYYPPGGSTGAALATILGKEPDRQIREDLLRFKQILETGEYARVDGQPTGNGRR